MTAPTLSEDAKVGIQVCGRACELALKHAVENRTNGNAADAHLWQNRAEWWSEQAFREVTS